MDIDALSAARRERWARLAELSTGRTFTGAEADEMTRLFQQTAGDLAAVQSSAPEPGLISRLSILLAGARIWMTGSHAPSLSDLTRIVTRELPAALYRVRWWAVGISVGFLCLALVTAVHTLGSPGALELVGTAQERAAIAQQEFENYYSTYDGGSFAAQVWTNNWLIAAVCIAAGISGFFPVWIVYQNAVSVGVLAAIMAEHGLLDLFFQLISPHGLLELSAVLVSASVGLRLFWTMLVPGARTRVRALAQEGRAAITIGLALIVVLLASGLIEAFVTPSGFPWAVKDAFGIIVAAAFWLYIFVVGRAATAEGATGDVEGDFSSATAPVAA
jgi:uncharacterized membrane protein SpoIIM required for sporulation